MMTAFELMNYLRERNRGWQMLLVASVCLLYLPFWDNPFFFDDRSFISNGAVAVYADKWLDFGLRSFSYASLGWIYRVFGAELSHVYHLGNMLLHAAQVILLFNLMRNLIGTVQPERKDAAAVTRGAFAAALIFALHPVAVYAVGYVVQLSILMASFFGLLMCWAYLRAVVTGHRRWLLLSVAAYFAACFSKEHSALLPMLIVALAILLRAQNRLGLKEQMLAGLAFAAIFGLVVLRAKGVLGAAYEPMAAQLFEQQGLEEITPELHLQSILTQAGLFFKYLLLWLLPNPAWMSLDMREPLVAAVSDWRSWLGLVGYMAYGGLALHWLRRGGERGLAGFALLYPWLLFPIEFAAIRVQEPFVLYRSYLWMPGLLLLIPLILRRLPERRWLAVVAVVPLALVLLSWNRLWVFADNYRMWDDAARLLKNERIAGADRIYFNRGQAEMALRKWEDAALDFERAAAISPQLAPVHLYLGAAYANQGRLEEALVQYDLALSLDPREGRAYFAKAMLLKRAGLAVEAKKLMEISCKLGNVMACIIVDGTYKPSMIKP